MIELLVVPGLLLLLRAGMVRRDQMSALRGRRKAGAAGERKVADVLARSGLDHVNDVTIALGPRATMQLDHVVRLNGSLLLLETKNWKGDIRVSTGNVEVVRNSRVVRRGNPITQVANSGNHLSRLLDLPVHHLVVLTNQTVVGESPVVVELRDLAAELKRLGARKARGDETDGWKRLRAIKRDRWSQWKLRRRHRLFVEQKEPKPWFRPLLLGGVLTVAAFATPYSVQVMAEQKAMAGLDAARQAMAPWVSSAKTGEIYTRQNHFYQDGQQ